MAPLPQKGVVKIKLKTVALSDTTNAHLPTPIGASLTTKFEEN